MKKLNLKTCFGSIKIEVLDKKPKMAADIANKCLDLVDVAIKKIKTERSEKAYFICEERKKFRESNESSKRFFKYFKRKRCDLWGGSS